MLKRSFKRTSRSPQAGKPKVHHIKPGEVSVCRLIEGVVRGKNEFGERVVATFKNLDNPGRTSKRPGPSGYITQARELARGMAPAFKTKAALAKRIAGIIRSEQRWHGTDDDPTISDEWIGRAITSEWRARKKTS